MKSPTCAAFPVASLVLKAVLVVLRSAGEMKNVSWAQSLADWLVSFAAAMQVLFVTVPWSDVTCTTTVKFFVWSVMVPIKHENAWAGPAVPNGKEVQDQDCPPPWLKLTSVVFAGT